MKGEIMTLEMAIPINGESPNLKCQIIGLEEVLQKLIDTNIFIPLYYLSQRNDVLPSFLLDPQSLDFLNIDKIIGEIISFDDKTITFKSTSDLDIDYTDKKIFLAYNGVFDQEANKFEVVSILYIYIITETSEDYLKYVEECDEYKRMMSIYGYKY